MFIIYSKISKLYQYYASFSFFFTIFSTILLLRKFSSLLLFWAKALNYLVLFYPRPEGRGYSYCTILSLSQYNKAILTDLNIEKHLRDIVYKHLHISLVHVTAGFDLEIHRSHSEETIGANGQIVSLNLATVKDGFYQSSNSNFIYEIINSKIAHKKHVYKLLLSDGTQANLYSENKTAVVSVGDNIVVNQNPINDGKYFTADTWFVISSGKIQKSGDLKKHKTKNGVLLIEQQGVKQMPGDLAFFENGEPLNSEISIGLFAKIKGVNGKIV